MDFEHISKLQIGDIDHVDEYFVELCALATSGSLTTAEWNQLEAHLAICPGCRAIKADYERVLSTHLPALAASFSNASDGSTPDLFVIEEAEAALFKRIDEEGIEPDKVISFPEIPSSRIRRPWLTPIAATVFIGCTYALAHLASSLAGSSSVVSKPQPISNVVAHSGPHESNKTVGTPPAVSQSRVNSQLAELERRLRIASSGEKVLEKERESLVTELSNKDSELTREQQDNRELEQELALTESEAQKLQGKLEQTLNQPALQRSSFEMLKGRVADLENQLSEKQQLLTSQEELLEHDRDIRNLMGARDLYIGEIYDVTKSGETKRPFGRVFYTQGKSLVFYAYDLDQQPGLKLASTFQAWGRRGVDQEHDVSLGIFYQDNQNKMRWILKSNDSVTLARLDAVFVTVEPHGESSKPTGKPFLFTYLRLPPNHP